MGWAVRSSRDGLQIPDLDIGGVISSHLLGDLGHIVAQVPEQKFFLGSYEDEVLSCAT